MPQSSHDVGAATLPGADDPASTPDETAARTTSLGSLYAAIWRWHFYAGLITAPLLWVVALTGAIYVFRTELTSWRDREILRVEPHSQRMDYEALRAIAVRELGTEDLDAIQVRPEPDSSVRFTADAPGPGAEGAAHRHRHVYLDPYLGTVLGLRVEEEDFFAVVLDLHRSLMMGTTGRILSELVTGWAVVLLATGLFLWWPRGRSNVGVWVPRLRGKLYAVLRDWHAVVGAYLLPLTLIITFTGLFFSVVWGTGFNTVAQRAGHWPKKWFATGKAEPHAADAKPVPLDRLVEAVLARSQPGDAAMIRLDIKPGEAHKAWLIQDEDKNSFRMVNVDPYSAKVLDFISPADVPFLYRVRLWTVSIHMGQIFGTTTKILALVAAIGVFGLSATGVWMWWRRRPRGRTGFPRRPPARSVPAWGWLVVVAAGIVMPVVGASMILIGLLELAWFSVRPRAA